MIFSTRKIYGLARWHISSGKAEERAISGTLEKVFCQHLSAPQSFAVEIEGGMMRMDPTVLKPIQDWLRSVEPWWPIPAWFVGELLRRFGRRPEAPTFSYKLKQLAIVIHKILAGIAKGIGDILVGTLTIPQAVRLRWQQYNTRILEQKLEQERLRSVADAQQRARNHTGAVPDQLLIDYPFDSRRIN
jgi:hypothetical protein